MTILSNEVSNVTDAFTKYRNYIRDETFSSIEELNKLHTNLVFNCEEVQNKLGEEKTDKSYRINNRK